MLARRRRWRSWRITKLPFSAWLPTNIPGTNVIYIVARLIKHPIHDQFQQTLVLCLLATDSSSTLK